MIALTLRFFDGIATARRLQNLFDKSDNELKALGLNRDALVRGYISSLGQR